MSANHFYHDVLMARDSLAESMKSGDGVMQAEVEADLGVVDSTRLLREEQEEKSRKSMMAFLGRDSHVKQRTSGGAKRPDRVVPIITEPASG